MNDAQLVTFGEHIRANSEVNGDLGNLGVIRDWYNAEEPTPTPAWKASVSVDEANDAIDWNEYMNVPAIVGGTVSDVVVAVQQGTQYARANAALAQIFRNGTFDPSLQTIRDSLAEIFSGDTNTIAALLAIAKENALWIHVVLGGATVQGALVRNYAGTVTAQDVDRALELTNA